MLINTLEIIIPSSPVIKTPPYSNNYIYLCPVPTLDLTSLHLYLTKINNDGIRFTNLIVSCGGEISNLSLSQITSFLNVIRPFFYLFQYKYVKTNGDLLKLVNNTKFIQFNNLDFIIKIPRFSIDDAIDNTFFKRPNIGLYIHDYANFANAKICWDLVCLNDISYESFSSIINELITKYNNPTDSIFLDITKIYGTNINAINIRELDFTNWILTFAHRRRSTSVSEGGISKNLDDDILDYINIFTKNCGLEFKEYWEWNYRGKRIVMTKPTNLQIRYNKNHIFYGNGLIDYNGNTVV